MSNQRALGLAWPSMREALRKLADAAEEADKKRAQVRAELEAQRQ